MNFYRPILLILILCNLNSLLTANDDIDYNEELFIKPLQDGKLFAQFKFQSIYKNDFKHLRWENKLKIFPLSIAELISATDLKKLHFSLTKGNWNNRNWGYSSRPAPPGAEIRVNFSEYNESPLKAWNKLINLLAGKFCASLIKADSKTRAISQLSFRNELLENSTLTSKTYYANLPEETLCTENITPWKKLLPCQASTGLASLLKPESMLKSSYSSLAIDLEPTSCIDNQGLVVSDCENVKLVQTFSVVFNPLLQFEGKQSWSFIKTFGHRLERTCQAARATNVIVDITNLDDMSKLYPNNFENQEIKLHDIGRPTSIRKHALYNLNRSGDQTVYNYTFPFNVGIKQKSVFKYRTNAFQRLPIEFITTIAAYDGIHGTLVATITNNMQESVTISYMDIIPNYMKVYVHTLTRELLSKKRYKSATTYTQLSSDREPTVIESTEIIPANDKLIIHCGFENSFLRWSDYKPDANKGVLIGPASIRLIHCPGCLEYRVAPISANGSYNHLDDEFHSMRLYSRPLLLVQPTPDFSMPYNVICLVSSILAAAFSTIYNVTTGKHIVGISKNRK